MNFIIFWLILYIIIYLCLIINIIFYNNIYFQETVNLASLKNDYTRWQLEGNW